MKNLYTPVIFNWLLHAPVASILRNGFILCVSAVQEFTEQIYVRHNFTWSIENWQRFLESRWNISHLLSTCSDASRNLFIVSVTRTIHSGHRRSIPTPLCHGIKIWRLFASLCWLWDPVLQCTIRWILAFSCDRRCICSHLSSWSDAALVLMLMPHREMWLWETLINNAHTSVCSGARLRFTHIIIAPIFTSVLLNLTAMIVKPSIPSSSRLTSKYIDYRKHF